MIKHKQRLFLVLLALSYLAVGGAFMWLLTAGSPTILEPLPRLPCIAWGARPREVIGQLTGYVSESDVRSQLEIISQYSGCVRTYRATGGLQVVPQIADELGLRVILGAWIGDELEDNETEIRSVIELARAHDNVSHVIVGNEVLLSNRRKLTNLSDVKLREYLRRVRNAVTQPVSTAEISTVWERSSWLADEVDFIAFNHNPYWSRGSVENALIPLLQTAARARQIKAELPVMFTEVGWPTRGPVNHDAVPGIEAQDYLLRNVLPALETLGYAPVAFEAFEMPEKWTPASQLEGAFGFLSRSGERLALSSTLSWISLQAAQLIVCLVLLPLLPHILEVRWWCWFVFLTITQISTGLLWLLTLDMWELGNFWFISFIVIAIPSITLTLLSRIVIGIEWLEVAGGRPLRRRIHGVRHPRETRPFVSLHIPCRAEDPDVVKETLRSLARLDYPNFEVLLIDNNTPDPALWRPVQEFMATLPANFKFYQFDDLPGFKAGALNKALELTDPSATIVGVVDADYHVDSSWLEETVAYFEDPETAAVQAPQNFRLHSDSALEPIFADECTGFFHVGMHQRNEDDAIILTGTLSLLRRADLEQTGRWSEWCITEDAELALRLLAAGKKLVYVARSYGTGLVPHKARGFERQRFRWVFGATQICRAHCKILFLNNKHLTDWQRMRFLGGWAPWFSHLFHPVFLVVGLCWACLFASGYGQGLPISAAAAMWWFPMTDTYFYLGTYRRRLPWGLRRHLKTFVATAGMTGVVSAAVWYGMFRRDFVFERTKKARGLVQEARQTPLVFRYFQGNLDIYLSMLIVLVAGFIAVRGKFTGHALLWAVGVFGLAIPGMCACVIRFACYVQERGASGRDGTK